jgi:hypothetical protein
LDAVADHAEDLTADWVTAALRSAGHDLTVTSTGAARIGTGQMGTTYRVCLAYDGEPGPPTLVAKVAGPDEASRAIVAPGYAAEVGFYRHLATTLAVRTPRCWYAAIAEDCTRFTLLLDDAAPATPGVQADGCTAAQAAAAIDNLVGLHAPRWDDPALHDLGFLMRADEATASMMGEALVAATDGFVDRYQGRLRDGEPATLRAVAERIAEWQPARAGPVSVVHGDYRLDNLLFSPSSDEVTAVDWQSVGLAPPLRDVAYFLGTSLDVGARRAVEEALVARYHDALVAAGIGGYPAARCWDDYRVGQLQGPLITVLGCMYAPGERTERSDAMFLAMIRRSCAAIVDLRSLELL